MWRKAHKTPQYLWDRNRYGPKLNYLFWVLPDFSQTGSGSGPKPAVYPYCSRTFSLFLDFYLSAADASCVYLGLHTFLAFMLRALDARQTDYQRTKHTLNILTERRSLYTLTKSISMFHSPTISSVHSLYAWCISETIKGKD